MKKLHLIFLSLILVACSEGPFNKTLSSNSVQDTAAAVKYFENEMNFTTGPGGVKSAIGSKNITIVDVRKEADFKAGHIPGAINLPFDKWDRFEGNQTDFSDLRKDGFNYVYCYELLCNLGQKAAKKFASLGYPSKEVKGGFQSWKDHKYPIEK
ncbi:MAG: rhodanese-like domain-containing protein [Alphaproteobacteria bacterium]